MNRRVHRAETAVVAVGISAATLTGCAAAEDAPKAPLVTAEAEYTTTNPQTAETDFDAVPKNMDPSHWCGYVALRDIVERYEVNEPGVHMLESQDHIAISEAQLLDVATNQPKTAYTFKIEDSSSSNYSVRGEFTVLVDTDDSPLEALDNVTSKDQLTFNHAAPVSITDRTTGESATVHESEVFCELAEASVAAK